MRLDPARLAEFVRYLINGVAAATVHFAFLYWILNGLGLQSAGVSNLMASIGGISASFLGSRFFVFRATHQSAAGQAGRFLILYAMVAALHGLILLVWTDIGHRDYRIGFLIATGLQVILSYCGNRFLVFNKR